MSSLFEGFGHMENLVGNILRGRPTTIRSSFSEDWDSSQRLDYALKEVDAVLSSVNNILTPVNVDNAVTTLASRLGAIYKRENKPQNLVSAASKFVIV